MAIGRYFRGLSAYDLLGNLLPGVVGLLAVLGITNNPPIPQTIGGVALFAAFAFIIGSIIQSHASQAVGEPRSFVRTMQAAETVPSLQYAAGGEKEGPNESEDDENTGLDEDVDAASLKNESLAEVATESTEQSRHPAAQYVRKVTYAPILVLYALVGPTRASQRLAQSQACLVLYTLAGPTLLCRPLRWGEELDDAILVNRIWEHLVDTYEIPFETDKYGVLYHLMSSTIDGSQSPSRALRMQAIRNFNRGMWVGSWYVFVTVSLALLADYLFDPLDIVYGGIVYTRPSYFTYWTPVWTLWVISLVGIVLFWVLYRSSEEDYIEYLFTDYAVAITNGETTLSFADDPVKIAAETHRTTQKSDK